MKNEWEHLQRSVEAIKARQGLRKPPRSPPQVRIAIYTVAGRTVPRGKVKKNENNESESRELKRMLENVERGQQHRPTKGCLGGK
jgi:hypothetical protein